MAKTFAVSGQHYLFDVQAFAHTILALGGVLLALYITFVLYVLIVYGLVVVRGMGKYPMGKFFKKVLPAALNAFGTCSSSATLPISKRCTDEMEVPNEISSLALPLGALLPHGFNKTYL